MDGCSVSFAGAERELIERTLRACGDNKTRAAELLRVSRKKLYAARQVRSRLRRELHKPPGSPVCGAFPPETKYYFGN